MTPHEFAALHPDDIARGYDQPAPEEVGKPGDRLAVLVGRNGVTTAMVIPPAEPDLRRALYEPMLDHIRRQGRKVARMSDADVAELGELVRDAFHARKKSPAEMVDLLNATRFRCDDGRPWDVPRVFQIIVAVGYPAKKGA